MACASLGADATGRTKQHRISKWRAESISKCARKTAWEQSRFCKEFSALSVGWGARIRTWEWRNQNPLPYHLATPQGAADHTWGSRADQSADGLGLDFISSGQR